MTNVTERRPGKPHLVPAGLGAYDVYVCGVWLAQMKAVGRVPPDEWRTLIGVERELDRRGNILSRRLDTGLCPLCARPTHDGAPCSPYQSLRDLRKSHPELFV